jgi:hypothetical protein
MEFAALTSDRARKIMEFAGQGRKREDLAGFMVETQLRGQTVGN